MNTHIFGLVMFIVVSHVPCMGETLVENGSARTDIIISMNASPSVQLAARELQYCIKQMSGCALPIIRLKDEFAGLRMVRTGSTASQRSLSLTPTSLKLKRYEYVIQFEEGEIILLGQDAKRSTGADIDYCAATEQDGATDTIKSPGMFDDQGTLKAAYHFLERHCGIRFYGPRSDAVHFPRCSSLVVNPDNVRRQPSIRHASGSLTWDWPIMKAQYGQPSKASIELFGRRMRLGGIPWYTNHTLHGYPKRFPKSSFPQYYASGPMLCYSSLDLARQVAQDARDYFDGKQVPDLQGLPEGSDYYPVVPADASFTFCPCPQCKRLLDPHRNDIARTPTGVGMFNDGRSSELWFTFINNIAGELKKTHPGKFISTLAYETYFWYPTGKLDDNVAVAPCLQTRNYWHQTAYENEMKHYERWVKDDRPIFLWNYYCFPEEPAVIRGWKCFPGFSAHMLGKMAKRFAEDGIMGTFFCGIGEQVDFYITLQLYHDHTQNIDVMLDEFFRLYFGEASKPMQAFYTLIEQTYSNPKNWDQDGGHHQTESWAWEALGTRERMSKLEALIMEAEAIAETASPTVKARVARWKHGVWDYMEAGRKAYFAKQGN
jgi:hypothetical protein